MKIQGLFFVVLFSLVGQFIFSQQTHSFIFTNASVHLTQTVDVASLDSINITNQGVSGEHFIRFGMDTYFAESDLLSVHNTSMHFSTGQSFKKAMSEIDATLFYIRITNSIGIVRLTLTVNRGFLNIKDRTPNVVSIYPNPFCNLVSIEGFIGTVSIFDVHGKLMLSTNVSTEKTQLNVESFLHGIYFVALDGKTWIKLVK
jgi:hypothetical protein